MADIRIKDLTSEASTSVTGDFLPIDGSIGTRKLSAYNPTFGGNATLGGTLTVNGAGSSAFATTAGFSVSTGITVPSGGVGVGAVGTGGSFYVNTPSLNSNYGSGLAIDGSYPGGTGAQSVVNVKAFGVMSGGGYGSTLSFQTTLNGTFNEVMKLTSGSVVQVLGTTASTSTSSGALVVSGGVGVAKELYVGSATESNSNTTGGLVLSGGLGVALNLNMGGRLFINNTSAANGALSASAVVATFGADATLGGLGFNVKGFPSATAGSRYIQLSAADSLDFRELRINDLGGNVLLGGATSTVKIGGSLQVGNAYVAGAPTATGYIVIKDSTGTSYKIPAQAL